jgi:alpha/beta superfamily hydrolase
VTDEILVPGGRDVRGRLDGPENASAVVVACPPHPQHGGDRSDRRLRAVSDALAERGVACLRFDYGPWDEGRGERADVQATVDWAADGYDRVGLYGFSFGASMALLAGGDRTDALAAVVALAPAAQVGDADVPDAVARIAAADLPVAVVYGERDDTADWRPVVDRAASLGVPTTKLSADHFFIGQSDAVAAAVLAQFGPVLDG